MNRWSDRLGHIGVWSSELRFGDTAASQAAAAELESMGYGALWVPGGVGGDILATMDRLLDATRRVFIASAIINIWKHEPAEIADWWHSQSAARQDRLLLGLGVSHGPLIGDDYGRPLTVMRDFVAALTALGVPRESLCIAALAPKMMELSRDLTAGAHPYLVTPGHTGWARGVLGAGPLLAPGQAVILESDPQAARAIARADLALYRSLPNYRASWTRQGFTDSEISTATDRFCDAIATWGTPEAIAAHVAAHLDAGADHICIKVMPSAPSGNATDLLEAWRTLSKYLI